VFAFPLMRQLLMAGVCGEGNLRESSAKVLRKSGRKGCFPRTKQGTQELGGHSITRLVN